MTRARWSAFIAIVMLILGVRASVASAHADLLESTPAANSVLVEAPTEIVLTFTEAVTPTVDAIRLFDSDGTAVEVGAVNQTGGGDTLTAAITGTLDNGTYVVAWRAVSVDSHPISGAFLFSVGAAEATDPALVENVLNAADAGAPNGEWIRIGRVLSFLGLGLSVGSTGVIVLCAPTLLSSRRTATVLWAGAGFVAAGTALMISAQAAAIGTSWTDWSSVLDTPSGRWWLLRLIGATVGGVAIVFRRRLLTSRSGRWIAALGALSFLAIAAAGGHAVSGRAVPVGFVATVGHLAAMSMWVGGLAVLLLVAPLRSFWSIAVRFSPVALASVATLAVTGIVNGWRQMGTLSGFTDSTYGRALLTKLVVVIIVVAIAAVSRWVLHHDIESDPIATADSSGEPTTVVHSGARRLTRTVTAEALGVLIILGVTSVLVGSPPPADVVRAAAPATASVSVVQGDRIAQIDLEPAVTGGTTMHVTITSPGGGLNDRADEITVTARMPAQGVGPIDIATTVAGPNHVTTNDADFPIPGVWEITVTTRYGEFDQVVFTGQLQVQQR